MRPSKVSEDDVRLMLSLVLERKRLLSEASHLTDAKIAEKFGVHANTVRRATRINEKRLLDAWQDASDRKDPEALRIAWGAIKEAVGARTAEEVEQMEREKNLR